MKKRHFTSDFYVEKLPLYLREGIGKTLNSYYSWLGLVTDQLDLFNIDFRTNIKLIQNWPTTPIGREYVEILSKGIYSSQFQNRLEFYFNEQTFKEKSTLIYYKTLAHLVETSTLRLKAQWRNIFYSFNLITKTTKNAMIVEKTDTLTLYLRPGTDKIVVWIFKNLLSSKWVVNDTDEEIWKSIDSEKGGIFAGFDGPSVLYEKVYFDYDSVDSSIEDKYE